MTPLNPNYSPPTPGLNSHSVTPSPGFKYVNLEIVSLDASFNASKTKPLNALRLYINPTPNLYYPNQRG